MPPRPSLANNAVAESLGLSRLPIEGAIAAWENFRTEAILIR